MSSCFLLARTKVFTDNERASRHIHHIKELESIYILRRCVAARIVTCGSLLHGNNHIILVDRAIWASNNILHDIVFEVLHHLAVWLHRSTSRKDDGRFQSRSICACRH